MASQKGLGAHERPPDDIRNIYKTYQKMKKELLPLDPGIVDISLGTQVDTLREVRYLNFEDLWPTFCAFNGSSTSDDLDDKTDETAVYEHPDIPGKEKHAKLRQLCLGEVRCSSDTAR